MLGSGGMRLSTLVVLVNGAVLVVGAAVLAFSPATVSGHPLTSELVVLVVGLGVMLLASTVLVKVSLGPLDRLAEEIDRARALDQPGPVAVPGRQPGRRLALAVNELLASVEQGRRHDAAAVLATQEAERSRIAQELHDGVGQSLTAVLLDLGAQASRPVPDREGLVRAREAVRASLDEVRTVARHLRPHVLEDLGLRSALAALTNDLFGHSDVLVRRGVVPGLPTLEDQVELTVFRVAQEALTNVARHAGARTVDLTLGTVGEEVVLSIADDGRGLPHGARGTGLRGMEERAALVDGSLEIHRREGGGTTVTLRVPLARATVPR